MDKISKVIGYKIQSSGVKDIKLEHTVEFEPDNCKRDYDDKSCIECKFRDFEMVSHPGGGTHSSVEKSWCNLGYWKDDF